MADRTIPVKGEAFECFVSLVQQVDTKLFQANPTLATGDVKVQTDDGTLADIATLPTGAAGSLRVKVSLSASEMNGDNVWIQFSDAAGAQWCDLGLNIQTSARGIDDLAYPAVSGRSTATDASGNVSADLKLWLAAAPAALSTNGYVQAMLLRWLTDNAAGTPQALLYNRVQAYTDILRTNTCQAGSGVSTIVFDVGASAVDDIYNDMWAGMATGAKAAQTRLIVDYDGASRTATIIPAWLGGGGPAAGDEFDIYVRARADVGAMAGNATQAGYLDAASSTLGTAANQTTILSRLGAWTGTGLNTILGAFRALIAKAASLTPTDLSTGTTFDNTTDSTEAVRDRGDAAWTTATGFLTDKNGYRLSATGVDDIWDEATSGHQTAGTTGKALSDAGASGDPLSSVVPGSYVSGTAGAALGLIGSGQILTTSPVSQGGDLTLVQGDDYNATENRALDWTEQTGSNWPTLTGATITVFFGRGGGDFVSPSAGYAGSVVTATGSSKKVRLELTSAQTAALPPGTYQLNVQARLATTNRIVTLVAGYVTIQADVR